jgi:hypothetical protein
MNQRLMDLGAEKVKTAIGNLPVMQVVRDQIEWEIIPLVGANGLLLCVPMICMPVPGSPDYVLHTGMPGFDPHTDQAEVDHVIRTVTEGVQRDCDQRRAQANGSGLWKPGG